MILFSYHPLLRGQAGAAVSVDRDDVGRISSILEGLPSGAADGCLWGLDGGGDPCVSLILESGREIGDHLQEWAEGEPESWFELQLAESGGLYALALVPDVRKSCDRHLAAAALAAGRAIPSPDQYSVLFRPLRFVSRGPSETFMKLRDRLADRMGVGILDPGDIPEAGLPGLDPGKIVELGKFRLVRDAPYIGSLLKQAADGS